MTRPATQAQRKKNREKAHCSHSLCTKSGSFVEERDLSFWRLCRDLGPAKAFAHWCWFVRRTKCWLCKEARKKSFQLFGRCCLHDYAQLWQGAHWSVWPMYKWSPNRACAVNQKRHGFAFFISMWGVLVWTITEQYENLVKKHRQIGAWYGRGYVH